MSLLKWAIIAGILAVISAVLGFSGLAEGFADIARVLFFIFLAGVILLVASGIFIARKLTGGNRTHRLE